MKNIYIYGLGKGKKYADRCLIASEISIIAYIDNYKSKSTNSFEGIDLISLEEINQDFDYIIITLMQYDSVKKELIARNIKKEKIICFFSFFDMQNDEYWEIIDVYKWRSELITKHYFEEMLPVVNNYNYELYADDFLKRKEIPQILSGEIAIDLICKKKVNLSRFGDNEFELIIGRRRTNYQEVNEVLGRRLKEVLNSHMDNLLIAIADNYGKLDRYTDVAASAIREYLGNGTRREHMELLDLNRQYYDAYLSRPYYMYRDKQNAIKRFENLQRIWENQDILIVEGEHTRFGMGNDLISNAKTVQRIITLDRDCFNVYPQLLEKVKENSTNKLVLVILGPVATIMCHDLAKENIWAVDIGQVDTEYEWFLRKSLVRCDIPYKTVSEVLQYDEIMTDDRLEFIKRYQKEIIARVV